MADEVEKMIAKKKCKVDLGLHHLMSTRFSIYDDPLEKNNQGRAKDSQKQFLIGQKIPIGVPLYSQEDIESSKFKINDSPPKVGPVFGEQCIALYGLATFILTLEFAPKRKL